MSNRQQETRDNLTRFAKQFNIPGAWVDDAMNAFLYYELVKITDNVDRDTSVLCSLAKQKRGVVGGRSLVQTVTFMKHNMREASRGAVRLTLCFISKDMKVQLDESLGAHADTYVQGVKLIDNDTLIHEVAEDKGVDPNALAIGLGKSRFSSVNPELAVILGQLV